jgi:hypothetical protein
MVDGGASLDVSIFLVEDGDDGSFLRHNDEGPCLYDIKVGHLMIVNAASNHEFVGGWVDRDDSHIGPGKTTVSATVDK